MCCQAAVNQTLITPHPHSSDGVKQLSFDCEIIEVKVSYLVSDYLKESFRIGGNF